MLKFLLVQGFVFLGATSTVLTTEPAHIPNVQDAAVQSSTTSWWGAEAMEVLLEVAIVIVVFGLSTPLLARARQRPSKSVGNRASNNIQLQLPTKGRNAGGTSFKAASTLVDPQSATRHLWKSPERPRFRTSSNAPASGCRSDRLFQYISINQLDGCCSCMLRELPAIMAEWVMDQEFVVLPHAALTSVVVARTVAQAHQFPEEFWDSYPSPSDLLRRLSTYVAINHLDVRCAKTLERLPLDTLRLVMDHEFVVHVDSAKGTASAKVVGHIMRMSRY